MNDHNDPDEPDDTDPDEIEYGPDGFADNHAGDMTSEEIREEALDMLAECDGAIVITGNLDEDEDAVVGAAIKFVEDELDDETRHDIHGSLVKAAMRVGVMAGSQQAPTLGGGQAGGLGALLGALAGGPLGPTDDDEDDDRDGPSMFA